MKILSICRKTHRICNWYSNFAETFHDSLLPLVMCSHKVHQIFLLSDMFARMNYNEIRMTDSPSKMLNLLNIGSVYLNFAFNCRQKLSWELYILWELLEYEISWSLSRKWYMVYVKISSSPPFFWAFLILENSLGGETVWLFLHWVRFVVMSQLTT